MESGIVPSLELDIVKGEGELDYYLAVALIFGPQEVFILETTDRLDALSQDDMELFVETWEDRAAALHLTLTDRRYQPH